MIDIFDEIDGLLSEEKDETTKATLQRIADHMRVTDSANVQAVGIAAELQTRIEELTADIWRLEQIYNRDGIAQVHANEIETIFDRWALEHGESDGD